MIQSVVVQTTLADSDNPSWALEICANKFIQFTEIGCWSCLELIELARPRRVASNCHVEP